jgi:tRNA dimethylallyltransferase
MTRRIEIALLSGRTLGWWHTHARPTADPLPGLIVLLDPPREVLYDRINRRVEEMVEEGLVEEVRRLLEAGFGPEDPGMTGAGYREIIAFLEGETTMEEAVDAIQRSHRNYARRQSTWFRHQLPTDALVLDPDGSLEDRVGSVVSAWRKAEGREIQ